MASPSERDRIMAEYLASVENDDEDEEDDEDEVEFQPGDDDDEEEEEDIACYHNDDNEEDSIVWKGNLTFTDGLLCYSGTTSEGIEFALKSWTPPNKPLFWDWNCPTQTQPQQQSNHDNAEHPRMRTIVMHGKPANVTLTITKTESNPQSTEDTSRLKRCQDDDDDDDDHVHDDDKRKDQRNDEKMATKKAPSSLETTDNNKTLYSIFGYSNDFELYGEFATPLSCTETVTKQIENSKNDNKNKNNANKNKNNANTVVSVMITCQYHKVSGNRAVAASAGAVATKSITDDDDDDDDDDDQDDDDNDNDQDDHCVHADQGVDYEELIALHQDARMSIGELQQQWGQSTRRQTRTKGIVTMYNQDKDYENHHENDENENDDDNDNGQSRKKAKTVETYQDYKDDNEEDNVEDEMGF